MRTAQTLFHEINNVELSHQQVIEKLTEFQKDAFHTGFTKGYDLCNEIHAAAPNLSKIKDVDAFVDDVKGTFNNKQNRND